MRRISAFCLLMTLVGCTELTPSGTSGGASLAVARQGFQTNLTRRESARETVETPPPGVFDLVEYDAPPGKLAAYLTPRPNDSDKHPAIIWITGGDCNTIGDVWSETPEDNDQTAAAFRQAGIVMMFPSLRGGNRNPGVREGLLGEVDDVLAAADFLARQDYVDPARIYLGGHSTGATLALLVSECSERFRAVFAFGPAHDIQGYGPDFMPFNRYDATEVKLRSPIHWLASIKSPTFVIEGTVDANLEALQAMERKSTNSQVHFLAIPGADHYSALAPANRLIARKILQDTDPSGNLTLTVDEIRRARGR